MWLINRILNRREKVCAFALQITGLGAGKDYSITADITIYRDVSRWSDEVVSFGSKVIMQPPVSSGYYSWTSIDPDTVDEVSDIVRDSVEDTLDQLSTGEMTEGELIEETKGGFLSIDLEQL